MIGYERCIQLLTSKDGVRFSALWAHDLIKDDSSSSVWLHMFANCFYLHFAQLPNSWRCCWVDFMHMQSVGNGGQRWGWWETEWGITWGGGHELNLRLWCCGETVWEPLMTAIIWVIENQWSSLSAFISSPMVINDIMLSPLSRFQIFFYFLLWPISESEYFCRFIRSASCDLVVWLADTF